MSEAGAPTAVLRRERAVRAVARLGDDLARWRATWTDAPAHTSQLARLTALLDALVVHLAGRADAIDPTAGFADARAVDADLAVVERLWRHYADRLDQRRDPAHGGVLAAADELVWSCTAEARALATDPSALPLPLPYLEPAFAPSALPRCAPPIDLEARDDALAALLAIMPVPLIAIPTSATAEPWWLVLIPHEVGHHIQDDLDGGALHDRTAAALAGAGGPRWADWSREVFADAFAVALLGRTAAHALAELEWDHPDTMAADRGPYPPILVRLALAHALADHLAASPTDRPAPPGDRAAPPDRAAPTWATPPAIDPAPPADPAAPTWALPSVIAAAAAAIGDPARRAAIARDLDRVPAAAAAIAAVALSDHTLRALSDRTAAAIAAVTLSDHTLRALSDRTAAAIDPALRDRYARVLDGDAIHLRPGRARPLLAIATAFDAYRAIAGDRDAASRERRRDDLRARVAPLVQQVRDPELVRAAPPTQATDAPRLARALALLDATRAARLAMSAARRPAAPAPVAPRRGRA